MKKQQNYFEGLLNSEVPVRPVLSWIDHRAELEINDVFMHEVKKAINSLKNWKAPGINGIPAELIKYGGDVLHQTIYELCQKIWKNEQLLEEWNKTIVVPLHKKGDKLNCNTYKGISLLNTAYKVFSKVLLGILQPFADECIGEYQCGYQKEKSTIDQLSVIGQIIEKSLNANKMCGRCLSTSKRPMTTTIGKAFII